MWSPTGYGNKGKEQVEWFPVLFLFWGSGWCLYVHVLHWENRGKEICLERRQQIDFGMFDSELSENTSPKTFKKLTWV